MSDEEFTFDDMFTSSDDQRGIEQAHVMIFGPEDAGKTFAGMSVSDKWTPEVVATLAAKGVMKKKVVINDVLHVGADNLALAGLKQHGIEAVNYLNIPLLLKPPKKGEKRPYFENIEDLTAVLIDAVIDRVVKTEARAVVFDTLSMFGQLFTKRAQILEKEGVFTSSRSGNVDKFAIGRWVGDRYRELHALAMALPCMSIFLAHARARTESTDAAQQSRKNKVLKAQHGSTADAPTIIPDIPAWQEIANMYTANCSAIFWLSYDKKTGERWLNPNVEGFLGKNKWRLALSEKEPPVLRAIVEKVKRESK